MTDQFRGQFGWAQRHKDVIEGNPALLSLWFMHLPNQAPGNAWSDFLMGVTHLRPMKGVEPPYLARPDNTHELMVLALEAGQTPMTPLPWKFMTPASIVVQFRVSSDLRAEKIAEDAAHACVDGLLIAESSIYMMDTGKLMLIKPVLDQWDEAVRLMAEHFETGGHHGAFN